MKKEPNHVIDLRTILTEEQCEELRKLGRFIDNHVSNSVKSNDPPQETCNNESPVP